MDWLDKQGINTKLLDAEVRHAPRADLLPVTEEIDTFERINDQPSAYENTSDLGRVPTSLSGSRTHRSAGSGNPRRYFWNTLNSSQSAEIHHIVAPSQRKVIYGEAVERTPISLKDHDDRNSILHL